jgi:hypothetical protein
VSSAVVGGCSSQPERARVPVSPRGAVPGAARAYDCCVVTGVSDEPDWADDVDADEPDWADDVDTDEPDWADDVDTGVCDAPAWLRASAGSWPEAS